MEISNDDGQVVVARPSDRGDHRALHGLTRTLIANMVQGVTEGFEKKLEIQGVGYRAALKGKDLELAVGYSHPVAIDAPEGIEFEVPQPTNITVRGISKQQVGQVAADDPQTASARAVQGQGHPIRGRARRPEGWQESMSAAAKQKGRLKRRRRVRAKVRGTAERPAYLACSAPTAGSIAQLIDDDSGRTICRRQLDGSRSARSQAPRAGRQGPVSCSPSERRRPGSTRQSSIAAVTAITAGSRPSPTAPARAA